MVHLMINVMRFKLTKSDMINIHMKVGSRCGLVLLREALGGLL